MTGAGDLTHRVAFEARFQSLDGAGGTETSFAERFTVWAGYTHLRGGETVLAGRLAGQHPMVVRARASSLTRQVTTAWRLRDRRTDEVFNIRDITPSEDRAWLDFLCEGGVAT